MDMETKQANVKNEKVELLPGHWRSMLPQHKTFVTELSRTGISGPAFALALALVRVLDFATYKSFSAYTAAQESRLSLPELTRAVDELVSFGALDVHVTVFLGGKMMLYRLGKAFLLTMSAPGFPDTM
jgi:hypothetical protein